MYHKALSHTSFALQRHLTNSGFTEIEIKVMGGWDAALAQMLGLWVGRRFKGGRKQKGTMITGLKGTARK